MQNKIDATLSTADRDKILDLINQIIALLPFLISLTTEEKRELPRMGDKSRAFVQAGLALAEQDDSFLPRSFDAAEMRQDEDLYNALNQIYVALAILFEKLQDTMQLTGSDLYVAALEIYHAAKRKGGSDSGGLDQLLDALGQRFAYRAKKTDNPPNP
ncbi:MAG: hypothetical protein WA584_03295 [Pyrinomonadaceae bacterium]